MALYMWNIILLISISYIDIATGALDASAVLLDCEKGSSKGDVKRTSPPYHTIDNCTRKIRITVNVTNSGKTPPDLDYSFLNQLSDPETGVNMYLLNTVVLRMRQDQVLLAYPFNYLSAVNARATEIVVNYQNRKNFTGCDDTSEINPTCGLKHDRGKSVPFSQGFCCFCPEKPVKMKQTRGGQDCSLDVGDPSDLEKQKYKASAHCLHLNDIWYSVSALNDPFIIHETYIQVFNQKHLKNISTVWVALTHDEDFELGSKNPYQYDENKTIVISYLTSRPSNKSIVIPIDDRRLLTPQPMPAVELSKLPTQVKNGASDYLLLPKGIINSDGDDCDVSGVSYEAFSEQPNRCNVVRDTCLQNQPLDFWEKDNEKRKVRAKGDYLLENYGIPYKDPIIIHPETKEHWLALEYLEPHLTVLTIEINADEIVMLSIGQFAQMSKVISSVTTPTISFNVSILNVGLMPAKYTVKAVKCAFGVPDSSNATAIIPPQMTQSFQVTTKSGSTALNEEFTCTVQVSSDLYGVVASREVTVNPISRCICNFHCECACVSDTLKCELVSEEDYHRAGFRGSLPILTAKPPHRPWILKHPFLALLAIFLFALLFGFIKGLLGLLGFVKVSHFGMNVFLYQPKKIERYRQPDLRNVDVVYDAEGYPIDPDTEERVQVIGEELLFAFNVLFLFYYPCLLCRRCASKAIKMKKKHSQKQDEEKGLFPMKNFGGKEKEAPKRTEKTLETNLGYDKTQTKKAGAEKRAQERPGAEKRAQEKPGAERGTGAEAERGAGAERRARAHKGFGQGPGSDSDSVSDSEQPAATGPVVDPMNKELERWNKGKTRIQAVRK